MTLSEEEHQQALVETKIEEWHDAEGGGVALHEWLGWSVEEYAAYVERGKLPKR
ncbi:MAG TPA: hypothetical protein VMF89_14085 [Polyangiales bacterium]|nr:hypothetical protein [Polyangiales bacterium]